MSWYSAFCNPLYSSTQTSLREGLHTETPRSEAMQFCAQWPYRKKEESRRSSVSFRTHLNMLFILPNLNLSPLKHFNISLNMNTWAPNLGYKSQLLNLHHLAQLYPITGSVTQSISFNSNLCIHLPSPNTQAILPLNFHHLSIKTLGALRTDALYWH